VFSGGFIRPIAFPQRPGKIGRDCRGKTGGRLSPGGPLPLEQALLRAPGRPDRIGRMSRRVRGVPAPIPKADISRPARLRGAGRRRRRQADRIEGRTEEFKIPQPDRPTPRPGSSTGAAASGRSRDWQPADRTRRCRAATRTSPSGATPGAAGLRSPCPRLDRRRQADASTTTLPGDAAGRRGGGDGSRTGARARPSSDAVLDPACWSSWPTSTTRLAGINSQTRGRGTARKSKEDDERLSHWPVQWAGGLANACVYTLRAAEAS